VEQEGRLRLELRGLRGSRLLPLERIELGLGNPQTESGEFVDLTLHPAFVLLFRAICQPVLRLERQRSSHRVLRTVFKLD